MLFRRLACAAVVSGAWIYGWLIAVSMLMFTPEVGAKGASGEVLQVGVLADFPPFESWPQEAAAPEGLDIELLSMMAECCGLRFEFRRFERFDVLVQALMRGDVQIITSVAMLPERARFMRFTRPYATVPQAFVGRADDTSAPSTPDLAGLRLGVTQGYVSEWLAQMRFPLAARSSSESVPLGLVAVQEGRADLLLEALPTLQALLSRPQFQQLRIKRTFAFPEGRLRFATAADREGLAWRLDDALGRLPHTALSALRARWIQPWQPVSTDAVSSEGALHPPWRVGVVVPDSWVDLGNHAASALALPQALVRAVADRLGVPIQTLSPMVADVATQSLIRREVDVVIGLSETRAARDRLRFVGPYRSDPLALVSHQNFRMGDLDQMVGRRLALRQTHVVWPYVQATHPEIEVVPCTDLSDCLDRVAQGQAEATVLGLRAVQDTLALRPSSGLQVTGTLPGVYDEENLAVLGDRPELAAQLNQALTQSLVHDLPQIERTLLTRAAERTVDWVQVRRGLAAGGLMLLLLVLGWSLHSRSLRYEVRRREQAQTVAEKARVQSEQYLAFMAHEVRNALQSVAGAVSMLRKAWAASETPGHLLEAIAQSTRSTLLLLTALLDRHRLKDGRLSLALCAEMPRATVDTVIDEMRPAIVSKGLQLEIDFQGEVDSWVMIDALRVQQVIRNLLVNAVKFSHRGTIRVSLSVGPMVQGEAVRRHIEVRVTDQGPGMDEATQALVLQGGMSVGGDRPGSGLGLVLSRELAAAMGGELSVNSALGRGSEFLLSFDAVVAPPPIVEGAPPRRQVLLVEDEPVYALLLQQALAQQGCDCALVTSLDEATSAACAQHFNLVLCDSHLPDGHAVDLLQRWRTSQSAGHGEAAALRVPDAFVAMSAELQEGDMQRLCDAGAIVALTKDADAAAMAARVLRMIAGHSEPVGQTARVSQKGIPGAG